MSENASNEKRYLDFLLNPANIELILSYEKAMYRSGEAAKNAADHAIGCDECRPDFSKNPAGEIANPCIIYQSLVVEWEEAAAQASSLFKKVRSGEPMLKLGETVRLTTDAFGFRLSKMYSAIQIPKGSLVQTFEDITDPLLNNNRFRAAVLRNGKATKVTVIISGDGSLHPWERI